MCVQKDVQKSFPKKKIYNLQPKNNKTIFTYNSTLCNQQTIKLFFFLSLLFFSLSLFFSFLFFPHPFFPTIHVPPNFFPAFPPQHMTTHVHHFFFLSFFLSPSHCLCLFSFSPSPFFPPVKSPFSQYLFIFFIFFFSPTLCLFSLYLFYFFSPLLRVVIFGFDTAKIVFLFIFVILLLVVFLFTQLIFVVVMNLSLLGLLLTFVCVISNILAQDLVFYFNFFCKFFSLLVVVILFFQ